MTVSVAPKPTNAGLVTGNTIITGGIAFALRRMAATVREALFAPLPTEPRDLDRHMLNDIGLSPEDPRCFCPDELRRRSTLI